MKSAAYVRVSSENQADNLSIPTQIRLINDYAERQGWPTPTLYEDRAVSAYTDDLAHRPAFARLVADAEAGNVDVLLVTDLDRLARNTSLALIVADRLTKVGCRIVSLNQGGDFRTPDGRLLYTLSSGFAEYASAQISRKSKAGLAHIKADGGYVGGLPYGALRDERYRLYVDPDKAETLRLILTLAVTHSTHFVAQTLNDAGVPPPRSKTPCWRDTAIMSVIKSGRWLLDQPEPWPALWGAAYSRPRLPRGRGARQRYELSGLLRCACGGALVLGGQKFAPDGSRLYTLHCRHWASGRPNGRGCPYAKTYVHRYLAAIRLWLLGIPDLRETIPVPLPDVAAARAALTEQRRIAFKGWQNGGMKEPEYDAMIAAIDAEEATLPILGGESETIADELLIAQALWDKGDAGDRNDILRGLGLRFLITGRQIEVIPRPVMGGYLQAVGYPLITHAEGATRPPRGPFVGA